MPKVNAEYLRDRRDVIVNAAMKLFATRGYAGTTMRMIATHAGGSLGAISNYFASKDSIIEASSQMVADHYLLGGRLDLQPDETAVDYISRLCRAAEQDVEEGVDYSRISIVTWGETMTSDEIRSAITDVFHEVQIKIAQQLRVLQEHERLPADLDPEAASVLIHAVVNGYMLHAQLLGPQPPAPLGALLEALLSPASTK